MFYGISLWENDLCDLATTVPIEHVRRLSHEKTVEGAFLMCIADDCHRRRGKTMPSQLQPDEGSKVSALAHKQIKSLQERIPEMLLRIVLLVDTPGKLSTILELLLSRTLFKNGNFFLLVCGNAHHTSAAFCAGIECSATLSLVPTHHSLILFFFRI